MSFAIFLPNFDEFLSEFRRQSQKITEFVDILAKTTKNLKKIVDNSGIVDIFHSVRMKLSITSVSGRRTWAKPMESWTSFGPWLDLNAS